MSAFVSRYINGCIDGVVGILMEPIREPLDFFVSSTKYVKDMKDEMEKLTVTKEGIQNRKEAAEANNRVVPDNVWPWLEEFEKLSQRSNSIAIIGPFNMEKRYKAGKESFEILKEIKLLAARKSNIEFTNAQRAPANFTSTLEHGYTFESRVPVFNGVLESLQTDDETQQMIALCGMGGLGKTTLIEQLNQVVQNKNMFHKVLKVSIGQTSDPVALQRIVAECFTRSDLTEKNSSNRAEHLRQEFVNMSENGKKKILVIMDDIWEKFDLKNVGLSPVPIGFKLLLVSRDESVCTRMRVQPNSIFDIRVLNDEEAEDLFFKIARLSPPNGDDYDALKEKGKRIAKKCRGLPMAIATIADNLSGSTKYEWEVALRRLEKDDLKDLESITHEVFEMSYENLQDDDYKAVFLLCGIFPVGFNIPIEDLVMYGWGLKLFTQVPTLAEARTRANTCVNNLIRANLLTKSDRVGCVKMHNLVRAFSLSNLSKVKQASIVNHDNMTWERLTKDTYERILLKGTCMSRFPTNFDYPNLLFFMLMDGYEHFKFPEDMLRRMKNLEVVSYENMGTPEFPVAFHHSSTLRTLRIHSCSLKEDISFIGSLSNLETLSLVDCNIRRLPSAIGKLEKLKLLDLTGCIDLYIDHGVFQNLCGLEELYMRAFKGSPIKFTHVNCDELEKISQVLFALELEFFNNKLQPKNLSFKNLERFRISIGCELKNYDSNSFRNTLNLATDCNELQESNIMDLFEKTEELRLQVKYMIHFEDISLNHTFSQLRILRISKCEDLTYLFTVDVANGLKQLERLTISECPNLESLIGENSGVGVVTLKMLNIMSLKDLPKMVSLCDNVIELPELVKLRLDGLPNFTSIYPASNSTTCTMQVLLNKEDVIPKLEELYISKMSNLKQIWPSEISTSEKNDVSTLKQIRVSECDSLINLFPRNPFPLLNHLEEVVVKKCDSIEVLFNIDFDSVCGIEKHSSSRLKKIELDELWKLKVLWRMIGVNDSDTIVNTFKNVQSIHIKTCGNFRDIFTPMTTTFDLGALTTYISFANSGYLEERQKKNEMIEGNQEINVTYPSNLLHASPHLQRIEISFDDRVEEVVFDMDSQESRQLATIQPPLLLSYVERIDLSGLNEVSHVWKCNWNKFLIPQHQPLQFPFQNLTHISLWFSHKVQYLFSPLMGKYLSKLKNVNIFKCDGMEEVISSRDDENTTPTSSHQNTTYFPCLDILSLRDLHCLKRIDGSDIWSMSDKESSNINTTLQDDFKSGQVMGSCWSLCQYSKKIYINNCDMLSSVISWNALGQMKKLEELEIYKCSRMTEVFESGLKNNNTNDNVEEGSGVGTSLLKSSTSVVVPQLSNLTIVCIYDCDLLTHIFTFSTLKTLSHLKELKVKRCKTIQVIVKEENKKSPKAVEFPRLETLELDALPNLEGFFLGLNDFLLPSLVNVMINDCKKWVIFTSGELETPKLKCVYTSIGKHSLEHGFNFQTTFPTFSDPSNSSGMASTFHNLIEIDIEDREVGTTIIPSHALLQLEKLQQITIKDCKGLQEVFEVVAAEGSGYNKSQTVVKIPNLTQVKIEWVKDIKYLWKSNPCMVLEFPNLTTLSLNNCRNLEHVFTCSMVGNLMQLQDLSIDLCAMKVIVKEEEEECDAKVNEIMLPRLKSIKLSYISNIKGFCLGKKAFSFPSLETLGIYSCKTLRVFTKGHLSTPKLKVIETSYGTYDIKTDLNSFIETKQEEGGVF